MIVTMAILISFLFCVSVKCWERQKSELQRQTLHTKIIAKREWQKGYIQPQEVPKKMSYKMKENEVGFLCPLSSFSLRGQMSTSCYQNNRNPSRCVSEMWGGETLPLSPHLQFTFRLKDHYLLHLQRKWVEGRSIQKLPIWSLIFSLGPLIVYSVGLRRRAITVDLKTPNCPPTVSTPFLCSS